MPDDAGSVELAFNGAWTPAGPTTSTDQLVDVANIPDGGLLPQVTYSEVADGILSPLPSRTLPSDAGASARLHVQTHVGFAPGVQAEALWITYPPTGVHRGYLAGDERHRPLHERHRDPGRQAASRAAPSFQTGTTAAGPTPAQPLVQWTLASGDSRRRHGSRHQRRVVDAPRWRRLPVRLLDHRLGGHEGTSLTVPALPASLAAYAPQLRGLVGGAKRDVCRLRADLDGQRTPR